MNKKGFSYGKNSGCVSKCKTKVEVFQHKIQLQLADSTGFPVVPTSDNAFCAGGTDTRFWVTLDIVKQGPLVTINIPLINFQTGPVSVNSPLCPNDGLVSGGYLYTSDGFLPKNVRPTDVIPRSIVAASNNGLSQVFSFNQDPSTLPKPLSGYIVQITNAGELQVQGAGTFGNIIPSGPQILMPCSITYIVKANKTVCNNLVLSNGPINTTQFSNRRSALIGLRDEHINDAFNGVVAWAWGDNSMSVDKTNGTLNAMVAVGTSKNGQLMVNPPIQLTNLPNNVIAFDASVAINRQDSSNIVASWSQIEASRPTAQLTITSPASLVGNYPALAGALSPPFFQIPPTLIVPADPLNADTPLVNDLTGKIALIAADGFQTGSTHKANNAFNAGAIGVIIFSDTNSPNPINGSPHIPTIIVGHDIGIAILNNQPVTGSIESLAIVTPPIIFRAVSFDGGVSWPINGPVNIQPTGAYVPGSFSDNRGIAADAFGNFWYEAGNTNDADGNYINQPFFAVSFDGGVTFTKIYEAPLPLPDPYLFYDFPNICFGGSVADGTYGLYFVVDYIGEVDGTQALGFIPISGNSLETIGAGTIVSLNNINSNSLAFIAASADSRIWTFGVPNVYSEDALGGNSSAFTYILPAVINFKSPGALDENLAGSWDVGLVNTVGSQYLGIVPISGQIAQPWAGFLDTPIVYDNDRQALYAAYQAQSPNNSQNMRIYFLVSRDNGMTWSNPIDISNTDSGNRGYISMALDTATGNLVFGWYDGRNDSTYQSVQYMAAMIPTEKLTKLVNAIPLSNPTFEIPKATLSSAVRASSLVSSKLTKKEHNRRFRIL
jgi:hypothetical protein